MPEEKLHIAKAMFDVTDAIAAEMKKRAADIVAGRGNIAEVNRWAEDQVKWFGQVRTSLQVNTPEPYLPIIVDFLSSFTQPLQNIYSIHDHQSAARISSMEIEMSRLLVGANGFRVSYSRKELAYFLINTLVDDAELFWETGRLVVLRTPSPFERLCNNPHSYHGAGWPLDLKNLALQQTLEVLGWKMEQTVGEEDVTLRIDFGAATISPDPMQVWYDEIPQSIREKADLSLNGDIPDFKTRVLAAVAGVYKNKVLGVTGVGLDPADEYFIEDLKVMKKSLAEMDLIVAALQRGVAAGIFTWQDFLRGRADYKEWIRRMAQARAQYAAAEGEARQKLWSQFEAMQRGMQEMKREIVRKIRDKEEALVIASWLSPETKRLRSMAEELGDLKQKLFEAGIVAEPVKYAVSSFLHDKVLRDCDMLSSYALMILDGAHDYFEKLSRFFVPLPRMIKPMLERLVDHFYSGAAAQGVIADSAIVSESPIRFAENISLELVKGVLSNLIENGIKYSDSSKPRRIVTLFYNGYERVLEYRDNGVGMEPEFAARLGPEAIREGRAAGVEGTGTGWRIIAHNLQALGWTYEIETAPRQGLKVCIRIPSEHLLS